MSSVDINPQLDHLLFRIWALLRGLGYFQIFHVCFTLNTVVDILANIGFHLKHHVLTHAREVELVSLS